MPGAPNITSFGHIKIPRISSVLWRGGELNLNPVKHVRGVFRLVLGWSVVGVIPLGSARGLRIDS